VHAEITEEHTTRTVTITVKDGPVIDGSPAIKVDQVRVVIEDGSPVWLSVSGGAIRCDGTPSPHHWDRGARSWERYTRVTTKAGSNIDAAPPWIGIIWNGVARGVTSWHLIESSMTGE